MRGQPINLSHLVLNAYLLAIKVHQDDSSLARTLAWKSLRTSEHLLPTFCVWREEGGVERWRREEGGWRSEGRRSSRVAVKWRRWGRKGGEGGRVEEGRKGGG